MQINKSSKIIEENPSQEKRKLRKKVTIIKKRHNTRDGSVSISKAHVYGMSVRQAIEHVQNSQIGSP